jgi:hypothetical protein
MVILPWEMVFLARYYLLTAINTLVLISDYELSELFSHLLYVLVEEHPFELLNDPFFTHATTAVLLYKRCSVSKLF